MSIMKFSVDKIEFTEEVNNSFFRKARIKAFASGQNSHTLPIAEDVLRRGATTIYNKPILWRYDKYLDDAMGHEEDEVPCGFIPEVFNSQENPITFERSEDGRLFIVINALLWVKYTGRLIEIFERDGNKKDVSIEIAILDSVGDKERPEVLDFVISGITILGEWVNPACKGCQAELIEFSEDKKKYEDLKFADGSIKINNSKEVAVSGAWSNPRGKLYNPIVNASNTSSLFAEAYLINSSSDKESPMSDHKYPHHVIKNGELVIHKDGLEAAFQRASQQGIVSGNVKSHLLRHYHELGLNTENFSEFNMTELQFNQYFSENIKNTGGEVLDMNITKEVLNSFIATFSDKMNDYSIVDVKDDVIVCEGKKSGIKYEIRYSVDDKGNMSANEDDMKKMGDANTEGAAQEQDINKEEKEMNKKADKNEQETTKKMADDEDKKREEDKKKDDDDDDDDDVEMSFEEIKTKYAELNKKFEELQRKHDEDMCNCAELKKFKEETVEKQKKEAEMAEMEKVMCDIESRGVKMSESDKKALTDKVKEFSSIEAWANFAKAQIFDKVEAVDGMIKIGNPFTSKPKGNSIWDRI